MLGVRKPEHQPRAHPGPTAGHTHRPAPRPRDEPMQPNWPRDHTGFYTRFTTFGKNKNVTPVNAWGVQVIAKKSVFLCGKQKTKQTCFYDPR